METLEECGSITKTAQALGCSRSTVRRNKAKHEAVNGRGDYSMPKIPDRARSIEEIIEAKTTVYNRRAEQEKATNLVPIKINIDGPIGLVHFGDPHLDDDGTNIDQLRHDLDVTKKTTGMFAGSVGDFTNNWIGRLARNYAEQTVTQEEAWALVEWMIGYHDKWLYLVGGNHDAWSGGSDPLKFIAKQKDAPLQYHGVRFELQFPNKKRVRVNTRHDFKGSSMWHPSHGPSKAAQMGFVDDILICGHKHSNAYEMLIQRDPVAAMVSHCIRVASYKQYDDYAKTLGYANVPSKPSCITLIDPYETDPFEVVKVRWNIDSAAAELNRLRKGYK